MRTLARKTLLAAGTAGSVIAVALGGAAAQATEIGAVVQRTYLGATAEGVEPLREIYFANPVHAQELVKTGSRGATELEFLDATRLVVGPNGTVKLDEFVYDPSSGSGGGQLSLQLGAFRFQTGDIKTKENLKLVTPTATMTIRGTHLVIFVDADGATEVNVLEGAIEVLACNTPTAIPANTGQRVSVTAGCATSVAAVRPMPREYIPTMPGSTDQPPGPDGPNGPDKPGGDSEPD